MIVRHYNRNRGMRKRVLIHPDAVLDSRLKTRESVVRELPSNLAGIGVVSPPRRVKVHKPRHVRRNQGWYTKSPGSSFYPYEPAPYLEFVKDVQRRYSVRRTHEPITTRTADIGHAARYDAMKRYGVVGNNADA